LPIRWLRRIGWPFRAGGDEETDYEQLGHEPGGLPAEYAKLVEAEMRRVGIPESVASLQVTQVALTPQGRGIYAAHIRLLKWQEGPAVRLLLGLPLLERSVRKKLQAHWVLEMSHFAGLWLQASDGAQSAEAAREIRRCLDQLKRGTSCFGMDTSPP
jgi:hypothetical protein